MQSPMQHLSDGGGGDKELFSDVLRANVKCFFFDVKENARGRYVKVAEKGRYRPKSSIVVPCTGLVQFVTTLKHFLDEAGLGRVGANRDIIIESKVFSFSAGNNDRGQFLRIFESGGGYPSGGSSLMVPMGWSNGYLRQFFEILERILRQLGHELPLLPPPLELPPGASEMSTPGMSPPDQVVLDQRESGCVLSVGSKHFFLEMRENPRGPYLKIKEVAGAMKSLLVVPAHAITKFQQALSLTLMQQPIPDDPLATSHGLAPAGP